MTDLLLLSDLHFTRISSSTYSTVVAYKKIKSVVCSLLLDRIVQILFYLQVFFTPEELKQALSQFLCLSACR